MRRGFNGADQCEWPLRLMHPAQQILVHKFLANSSKLQTGNKQKHLMVRESTSIEKYDNGWCTTFTGREREGDLCVQFLDRTQRGLSGGEVRDSSIWNRLLEI